MMIVAIFMMKVMVLIGHVFYQDYDYDSLLTLHNSLPMSDSTLGAGNPIWSIWQRCYQHKIHYLNNHHQSLSFTIFYVSAHHHRNNNISNHEPHITMTCPSIKVIKMNLLVHSGRYCSSSKQEQTRDFHTSSTPSTQPDHHQDDGDLQILSRIQCNKKISPVLPYSYKVFSAQYRLSPEPMWPIQHHPRLIIFKIIAFS